jgi:hypothetical protein
VSFPRNVALLDDPQATESNVGFVGFSGRAPNSAFAPPEFQMSGTVHLESTNHRNKISVFN